ncbi:32977_t:CDS:2, partial [Racocetra persica]
QFSNTVEQTDQLLDIWINILSQSIHTQQLLSDPSWQGSSARVLEEQAKERERQEKLTRLQQERLERERLRQERLEQERLEQERLER